ncbi:hypothetical protein DLAC_04425 [Tieghemostelium lacteum]|uniref:MAGE domain-containing protein n=1 Tax=Tieghemostelium lacteum TaxID=361077 RepID=A0A151ZJQ8_TIELA|nr:hypothetical protein DLAC_04425 [Tieghemostelium lacteum]|eukprot:KYQ94139.1 hypothetical protein DLAC_04425 [Tieghemostelium lacteum]
MSRRPPPRPSPKMVPKKRPLVEEEPSEEEESDYSEEEESEEERPVKRGKPAARGRGTTTTTSSQSASQATQQATKKITDEEHEKCINDFVRYILFVDRKKTPISRTDITSKLPTMQFKDKKLVIDSIFKEGIEKLRDIFGYEMVATNTPQGSGKSVTGKKAKVKAVIPQYMLKNTIDRQILDEIDLIDPPNDRHVETETQRRGLLFLVQSIIIIEGGILDSEQLEQKMERVGFEPGKNHPVFGQDLEKELERMVREGFINRKKDTKEGKNIKIYTIGARTLLETSKKKILESVQNISGEIDPMLMKSIEDKPDASSSEEETESSEEEEPPRASQPITQRTQSSQRQQSSQITYRRK